MIDVPTAEELRRQVEDIQELATLPHIMARVIEVVANERASAEDLATEIRSDPSLTAKLLKIVNSAFYGFYREISKLSDVVVILGFEEVKRISIAISVVSMLEGKGGGARQQFWKHCLLTAGMAQFMEKDLRLGTQGAFTAGLLHDIGHAVLDQYLPDIYAGLQDAQTETHRTPAQVEHELLGVDHGDIGAWVAERWNLPPMLVDAIQHHHKPGEASDGAILAAIVHIADILVHEAAPDTEHDPAREIDPIALDNLNLGYAQVDDLRAELQRLLEGDETLAGDLLGA